MANEKLVTLSQLQNIVKPYIDGKDAKAFKSIDYADNKLSFYTTEDKSGEAAATVDLPEEMFLDQTKTAVVNSFAWSEETYPGSTNPNLDGEPVLVLAVKGDDSVSYSFASLKALIDVYTGDDTDGISVSVSTDNKISATVKVSAESDNVLEVKSDGIYVPEPEAVSIATDDEMKEIFKVETT